MNNNFLFLCAAMPVLLGLYTLFYFYKSKNKESYDWSYLPLENSEFQPRREKISELNTKINMVARLVVSGLAGNGKTSLVVQWANQKKKENHYRYVRYMRMDVDKHATSIVDFAADCGVYDARREGRQLPELCREIAKCIQMDSWLIIWDNVEKKDTIEKLLQNFIPDRSNKIQHMVLTSRSEVDWGDVPVLPLDSYTLQESYEYVCAQMNLAQKTFTSDIVREVTDELAHHPLALELAMGQIRSSRSYTQEPLKDLLLELRSTKNLASTLNESQERPFSKSMRNENNLRKLWKISERDLHEETQNLLRWRSFLDPEMLSIRAIDVFFNDKVVSGKNIHRLREQSFIQVNGNDDNTRMHRLLQRVVREDTLFSLDGEWRKWYVFLQIGQEAVEKKLFVLSADRAEELINKIESCLVSWESETHYPKIFFNTWMADLAFLIGKEKYDLIDDTPAKAFFEKALLLYDGLSLRLNAGETLLWLGKISYRQGNFIEAGVFLQKSLKIYESLCAPDEYASSSLQKAEVWHKLSNVAYEQCDYDETLIALQEALKIYQYFDEQEPTKELKRNIASAMHQIANVYFDKKNYSEAKKQFTEVLKKKKEVCNSTKNPRNFDIATTLHQLGRVAYETQEYDSAEKFFLEALAMKRYHFYGNRPLPEIEHPSIGVTLYQLGMTAYAKKEYDKYSDYFTQAMTIYNVVFRNNPNHIHIALVQCQYGRASCDQGLYDEAIEFYNDALNKYRMTHRNNSNHPDIFSTLYKLGDVYRDKQELNMAKDYYQQAFDLYNKMPRDIQLVYADELCKLKCLLSYTEQYNQSSNMFLSFHPKGKRYQSTVHEDSFFRTCLIS